MILTVFLQSGGQSPFGGLPLLLLLLLVMYFFFFRPQIKRQKEESKFRKSVSKGMRIVTTSGIHGKILDISDDHIIIESENSRLRIDKSAISKEMSAVYLPKKEKDKMDKQEKK